MTTLVRIEIIEEFRAIGKQVFYELDPGLLPPDQLSTLCQLVERCHVLEHEEMHFGPVQGEHEVSIAIETSSSLHEIHACDTELAGPQGELATFVKGAGRMHDDRSSKSVI